MARVWPSRSRRRSVDAPRASQVSVARRRCSNASIIRALTAEGAWGRLVMLSLCASVRWSTRGVFVRCLRLILATVGLEAVSASLIITIIIHA